MSTIYRGGLLVPATVWNSAREFFFFFNSSQWSRPCSPKSTNVTLPQMAWVTTALAVFVRPALDVTWRQNVLVGGRFADLFCSQSRSGLTEARAFSRETPLVIQELGGDVPLTLFALQTLFALTLTDLERTVMAMPWLHVKIIQWSTRCALDDLFIEQSLISILPRRVAEVNMLLANANKKLQFFPHAQFR